MSLTPQVMAILGKLEAADLPILAAGLLPALEEEANTLLPAADQATAVAVETVVNPALQAALASLIAKIPVVS
jgi:hypothetical protein